jgi:hypothetical protein
VDVTSSHPPLNLFIRQRCSGMISKSPRKPEEK